MQNIAGGGRKSGEEMGVKGDRGKRGKTVPHCRRVGR